MMVDDNMSVINMLKKIREQLILKTSQGKLSYESAYNSSLKWLNLAIQTHNHKLIGEYYILMFIVEYYLGTPDHALSYIWKAIEAFQIIQDVDGLGASYNNLGETYRRIGQL